MSVRKSLNTEKIHWSIKHLAISSIQKQPQLYKVILRPLEIGDLTE